VALADEGDNMRKAWKQYLMAVLPHAKQQVGNFMLACIAEGRNHEIEDEAAHKRGATLTCNLTHEEICAIMTSHRQKDMERAEVTKADTRSAQESSMAPTYRRMATTTALAVRLAEASGAHDARVMSSGATLRQYCLTKPASDAMQEAAMDLLTQGATVSVSKHNWKDAYARWLARVRDVILNEGNVPNEKQEQVLSVVHERCVTEETVADGTTSDPLLRLVHGLPGSGKSRLLVWLRSYFEDVWQWAEGRERVKTKNVTVERKKQTQKA